MRLETEERVIRKMKFLKQTLFMAVVIIGLSVGAFAQKDDGQKRPKPKPPVVVPGEKKPPKEGSKERPKKPEMSWFFALKDDEISVA